MTENLKDSFVKAISDRLSNQLLVAFCISWCVVNFNFFIAVFKIADFAQFIKIVSSGIFSDFSADNAYLCLNLECGQWFYRGVFLPSVLALLYIFLSPFSRLLISNYHQWHDALLKKTQNYWDNNFVVTRSDWNESKYKYSELLIKFNSAVEDLNAARIASTSLREENEDLKLKISGVNLFSDKNGNEPVDDSVIGGGNLLSDAQDLSLNNLLVKNPLVREVLEILYENDGHASEIFLRNQLSVNPVDLAHVIDILKADRYVTSGRDQISFLSRGNAAAVKLFSNV